MWRPALGRFFALLWATLGVLRYSSRRTKVAQAARPLRVLVVDDEKIIADTLALILKGEGHTVRVAYGGASALSVAEEYKPDLLVSDVVMPDLNGVALADRFFKMCPDCKVILMSGNAATRSLLELAAAHGQNYAFLEKPFRPKQLLALMEQFEGL